MFHYNQYDFDKTNDDSKLNLTFFHISLYKLLKKYVFTLKKSFFFQIILLVKKNVRRVFFPNY